jgi:hypothetical protein
LRYDYVSFIEELAGAGNRINYNQSGRTLTATHNPWQVIAVMP